MPALLFRLDRFFNGFNDFLSLLFCLFSNGFSSFLNLFGGSFGFFFSGFGYAFDRFGNLLGNSLVAGDDLVLGFGSGFFLSGGNFGFQHLADAQADALLLGIHTQHLDLDFLADLHGVFHLGHAGRRALADVHQAVPG